jgi:hypothetical protein
MKVSAQEIFQIFRKGHGNLQPATVSLASSCNCTIQRNKNVKKKECMVCRYTQGCNLWKFMSMPRVEHAKACLLVNSKFNCYHSYAPRPLYHLQD